MNDIVFTIDPGSKKTGWCVMDGRCQLLQAGLIKPDKQLAGKIAEIKEFDCTGGVIVEDVDGAIRVDNTYDTRLEMLLPKLLPEIGKELFRGE